MTALAAGKKIRSTLWLSPDYIDKESASFGLNRRNIDGAWEIYQPTPKTKTVTFYECIFTYQNGNKEISWETLPDELEYKKTGKTIDLEVHHED